MFQELKPAVLSFLGLTLISGLLYPLVVTGISQATMPEEANGSLIVKDGKPVGSRLIGQNFSDPGYFWGRPSAISPKPYDATASGGSNQGPTNPVLIDAVKSRVKALKNADPGNKLPVPVDLVTTSASGLDPEISPLAAAYQIGRVARARGLDASKVKQLVEEHTRGRQFGILGEPRVNVLELNLKLDTLR